MKKLEIKGNLGTGQYGIIVTENSKIFFDAIASYVVNTEKKNRNKNIKQIYDDIEQIWELYRDGIYSDIEDAGEDLDDHLCFNGEIITEGKSTYFEFY